MQTTPRNPYAVARPAKFKVVLRWSSREKLFRLFRVVWDRIIDGRGIGEYGSTASKSYSAKFSAALSLDWTDLTVGVRWFDEDGEGMAWIHPLPGLALRLHWQRSYGGLYE